MDLGIWATKQDAGITSLQTRSLPVGAWLTRRDRYLPTSPMALTSYPRYGHVSYVQRYLRDLGGWMLPAEAEGYVNAKARDKKKGTTCCR